jgi:hypothetical protein
LTPENDTNQTSAHDRDNRRRSPNPEGRKPSLDKLRGKTYLKKEEQILKETGDNVMDETTRIQMAQLEELHSLQKMIN